MSRLSRSVADWIVAAVLAALILVFAGLATAGADEPAGPAGDHLVVSRLPVAANAQAVTLLRFNGAGVSDGANWALPTTASGANNRFTLEGNSNAVGALARSADGRYVTLAGYTAALGATLGTSADTAPRVVARVDSLGNVDTSTTLSTNFTQEKIRGAVTSDGSGFWVTGHGNTASPKGGMVYAALGSKTPTVLFTKNSVSPENSALNNTRTVEIAGGNVYFGSEKGTAGIYRTTGLPKTAQAPVRLAEFGSDGSGPTSLALLGHEGPASAVDLMYAVQEGSGIYKFSLSGSTWTNRGKVASGSFNGVVAKVDSDGHFRLYAISGEAAGNKIVTLTDKAAYNAAPSATAVTTVSTAAAGTAYRGIAFAPFDESLDVPGVPSAVGGTAGDSKVSLAWTDGGSGGSPIIDHVITPYIGGVAQAPINTGSSATSYTVEGLANGTTYTFAVAAANANGTGAASTQSGPLTPEAPGAPNPTISLSESSLSGSLGDPTNPTVDVTVAQAGIEPSGLIVEAIASTNTAVAAAAGVKITGSGATRTVSVAPAGAVGYADVTLRVTGAGSKTATTVLHYAASAAGPKFAESRFHTFASDASTAIDVGNGYVLLGNDENNQIRMYKRDVSGAPVKSWDFNSQMGNPEEIDIEASARVGNTIYWTGSMGNSKKGNLKPDRSILFTTKVSGSGAATELSFGGYYRGLRADLIAWDQAHGNQFGFAAGAAAGNIPKQIDGFNAEGMEFAPGSSEVGYIGFRAPLSPATPGGYALVVPVTNLGALATSGQNTSLHATFGEPILMDLGGLSIREIRRNANDEYMIVAGSWAATGPQALYVWKPGAHGFGPFKATDLPAAVGGSDEAGAYEGVASLPTSLAGGNVRLVADLGATDLYGDGQEAKELIAPFQKSREDRFEYEMQITPFNLVPPTMSGNPKVGQTLTCDPGQWWGAPVPELEFEWLRNGNGLSDRDATYTVQPADAGKPLFCRITARNSNAGSTGASAPSNKLTISLLRCDGGNLTGAGSTLQNVAQTQIWKPGFEGSACNAGTHPTVTYQPIGSGAGMSEWNYDGAKGSINTGLGFIATDEAPTAAQIANIKSKAGGAEVAVIPVAQTAISLLANPPAGCTVEAITNGDLAAVMEGRLANWSKLETAEGTCNSPITRVVRKDGSGTTYQLKNYLAMLYKKGLFCTTGATEGKQSWQEIGSSTSWPESCTEKALSSVLRAQGGIEEVNTINATPGSIGYAALPDAKANAKGTTAILGLQNNGQKKGGEANFADPAAGSAANCGGITYKVPITNGALDIDWSGVFGAKPAIGGESYPLCTLTYDLAFHGYQAAGFSEGQEITAYDYLNGYIVRTAGQSDIAGAYYAPLPASSETLYDVLGAARRASAAISW